MNGQRKVKEFCLNINTRIYSAGETNMAIIKNVSSIVENCCI